MCGGEKHFFAIPYSTYDPLQKAAVAFDLTRSFSSSSAAGTNGCLDLSSCCCVS